MPERGRDAVSSGRRLSSFFLLLTGIVALLLLPGCHRIDADQAQAVRGYAAALAPALHAESLEPLRQVALPDEVERVQVQVMATLYKEHQRVTARLASFRIESSKTTGSNTAEVETSEAWSLAYEDSRTGKRIKRADYRNTVRYELIKQDGRWFVSSVETK